MWLVLSPTGSWGFRRPETKYFMGKESTCHDPERKPRNKHEISTSHGFHDVQKKMSLQNLRTSLSNQNRTIHRFLTNVDEIYPPLFFPQEKQTTPWCWWNTPPQHLPQQHLFASPSMRHHPWIELASIRMTSSQIDALRNSTPKEVPNVPSDRQPKQKYPPKV